MAVVEADSTEAHSVKGADDGSGPRWTGWPARMGSAIATALARENSRLTIWSPVFLVIGIWTYFGLSTEPGLRVISALLAVSVFLLWQFRRTTAVVVLALVAIGFSLASLRSAWVATPLLRSYTPGVELTGLVVDIDQRSARRHILTLDVVKAGGVVAGETPVRVRVQFTGLANGLALGPVNPPQIGDLVSGTAILTPLPIPVSPGAFDFGRSLYFESVGATGRFTVPPVVTGQDVPYRYQVRRAFHRLRRAIGERVHGVIEGPTGSFADALITGERAQIPKAMNDSLRASGLFHILSISGLHMALVAGSAFWIIRALLALSPRLALDWPIKKWAAAGAVVVGLFYMLLADSGAATERSFIMIAVMFFAVLVDRPAISLHNLAIAALIVLVLEPEQAVSASFQMSFLAVMGLASFFEWWNRRVDIEQQVAGPLWVRWVRKGILFVLASAITSLIAGSLSGIAAAHHFGRIAPYGVVANALALPIVSVAVMPMALLATVLMPFGLEKLPLLVMERGLNVVMAISDWVSTWPHAGLALPLLSPAVAVTLSFVAAFVCMSASSLRWLAVPAACVAAWLAATDGTPDIFVEERAKVVAAVAADGLLVPSSAKGSRFAVSKWLAEVGQAETPAQAAKRALWLCDAKLCSAVVAGRKVAYLKETAELAKPCPAADVVIAQYPLRRKCKGKLATIDRFDVWRKGAHTITFTDDGVLIATVRETQGVRPWVFQPRARAKAP